MKERESGRGKAVPECTSVQPEKELDEGEKSEQKGGHLATPCRHENRADLPEIKGSGRGEEVGGEKRERGKPSAKAARPLYTLNQP